MPLKEILKRLVYHPSGRPMPGAIRYRIVIKYLGMVLLILGVESAITAALSFKLAEGLYFNLFYLIMALFYGGGGLYLFRTVPEREITVPEVAAVASASFLLASILGAVPFFFLDRMPLVDAWFESMSGFTTTGFSLMDVTTAPRSLIFMRAFSQWLGGMGFMVITVSILLVSGSSAVTLLNEGVEEKLFPRISRHIQVIFFTYTVLTVLGVVLLLLFGLDLFDALCYTLSGLSTGGFAPNAGGLGAGAYKKAIFPVMLIMAMGATNFILYYESWKRNRGIKRAVRAFFVDRQVLCLILLIFFFGLAVAGAISGEERWLDGFFMAASAQTTTGYTVMGPGGLTDSAMMLLVPAMFIGGAMGSTAGGVKLHRLMTFFKSFNRYIVSREYPEEIILPGGVTGKGVAKEELHGIFYVIFVYAIFVVAGAIVFVLCGFNPLRSIFEVTSAVGTVGLSSGIVSPGLNWGLKVLLALLMWGGRLEFIPVLIWFYSFSLRLR